MATVELKNVSYIYNKGTPYEAKALDNINLTLTGEGITGLIGHTGSGKSTMMQLINALLKNPEFKEKFLRRFAWQMDNIWSTENVTARVNELENLIKPEMQKDCDRWGYSYNGWLGSVEYLRKFPAERTPKMTQFIQAYFGLTAAQMEEYGFHTGG